MKEIKIQDMKNFRIGSSENRKAGTGCTVIICPEGAPCGIDVRGGGPASRETELLKPVAACEKIHAIALCGGSAFGLNAAGGVMKYLEEHDIGFETRYGKVPLVCASSIFDLGCGDSTVRPDEGMGYAACLAAEQNDIQEGNHGAGTGATVGKLWGAAYMMKSGLGIYAVEARGLQVAAVVAVNAVGDVYDRSRNCILAGMLNKDKNGFACSERILIEDRDTPNLFSQRAQAHATNTTIAAIITNAAFDKTAMNKIAAMAGNGMVRAISPVNTMADGDSVYAVSVGTVTADINIVGTLAAYVLEKAIGRAVLYADSAYGIPAVKDLQWKK